MTEKERKDLIEYIKKEKHIYNYGAILSIIESMEIRNKEKGQENK